MLAPALYQNGFNVQQYKPLCSQVSVVHGWNDDIIPVERSIRFAQEHKVELNLINSDHRLNDSLDRMSEYFENFLNRVEKK